MIDFFKIDFKKLLLVLLVIALPLIAINLERRDAGSLRWYDKPAMMIINPSQELFSKFATFIISTTKLYLDLIDVKTNNRVLKEELSQLKYEMGLLQETKIENERLKKQLGFQQESPSQLVNAQVVAVDLLWSEYKSLQINKGTRHGLKKGMAVITHSGVVGYLLNTTPSYSTVLVMTDRNAVIDSIIQRTRARGIVEGLGQDSAQVKYLQRTDDVQVNDLVVTSGYDKVFPKGLPIGTVTKVLKKPYGVTQKVELSPVVDTSRLEEVFVVVKPNFETPVNTKQDQS